MDFSQVEMLKDKRKQAIPQLWDPKQGTFVPLTSLGQSLELVAKEPFSGSATITKTFNEQMRGFVISNDGDTDLTFTISDMTYPVKAGEVFEEKFDPFTTVTITTTSSFRAYGKGLGEEIPPADTTPPEDVADITASNITSSGMTLNWTASVSTDTTGYDVFQGSTQLATVADLTYQASNLPADSDVTFTIKARDGAGNVSAGTTKTFHTAAPAPADTTPPTVTASVSTGTYTSTQTVTLTADESATIYYTLDGSTPTTSSPVYSGPITINNTATLKFFGKDTAGNASAIQSITYTINIPDTTPPAVTISPAAGTYGAAQSLTLSANEQATIYYTLDGTTPTEASTVYGGPISVSSTTTIKYFAKDSAGNASAVQSATYNLDTVAPEDVTGLTAGTPTSNSIPVSWSLSASSDVKNYEVAYSTDGQNFSVASAVVNPSSTSYTLSGLTAGTAYTIRVVAIDNVGNRSAGVTVTAATGAAPSDTTSPTVTASPAAGTYTSAQSVTLTATDDTDAIPKIYYTLDGTDPTTASTLYSAPISINATTTIKFIAADATGNQSAVQGATYTINLAPTAAVTDDFNRADQTGLGTATTGQAWMTVGNVKISNNQAWNSSATEMRNRIESGKSDCSVQITVNSFTPGTTVQNAVLLRAIDDSNLYYAMIDHRTTGTNTPKLYKRSAGAMTLLATGTEVGSATNYTLKAVANGTNIELFYNGTSVLTFDITDGFNQTATQHGFSNWNGNAYFDDFSVNPL